jgi:transcriptional regulator with XRE-family HTH domain
MLQIYICLDILKLMNEVRLLRRRTGVSQRRLAQLAGTSQPTIAAYETGKKTPSLRTLRRLARAVGLEARTVFVPPMTREDRRSLALHEAIAERLTKAPREVVGRARRTLALTRKRHPGAEALLDEWDALLRLPVSDLVEVLRDPRPRARELRHVTPFAGVLSAGERTNVYRAFETSEDAAR